jgi:hypothetical protein
MKHAAYVFSIFLLSICAGSAAPEKDALIEYLKTL